MADIDIGAAAIDRETYMPGDYTSINDENPANASGAITSVEIYAVSGYDLTDCEVATFYVVSGDNLTTRDSETIGDVTGGSKQTFSGLDMDVETGDYIGIYHLTGRLECGTSAGVKFWYKSGDYIPCTNESFSYYDGYAVSLYGEGETAGVTEKTSSDTGSGADAYVSLETLQAKASSDTGSGADTKASGNPVATLIKAETGSGSDVLSQVQAILEGAETGSGVDAVDSLQTPEAKSSSDAGSGVEGIAVPSATLVGSETGSGVEGTPVPSATLISNETGFSIEALIARLLTGGETAIGAEASSIETEGGLQDLLAGELGEGSDCLTAKIEMPTKGGGIKLWI